MRETVGSMAVGGIGETLARLAFQKIGWAPPMKIEQDIGDDLLTFARVTAQVDDDPRAAYDLSSPVFLQVKSSDDEFLDPPDSDDNQRGWWFADSNAALFDHWLGFGLPYLLVLVDTRNEVVRWAEVSIKTVVPTGTGRKIFVPASQLVGNDSADRLVEVATRDRKNSLEGTAWSADAEVLPTAMLRTALVVPRLVAPHPNTSPANISYEQAVAMLVRNRGWELHEAARNGACPARDRWASHRQWGWRFADAVAELLETGGGSRLAALSGSAPRAYQNDTCRVLLACLDQTVNESESALDALKPGRRSQPIDRAWMLAHRAHINLELGTLSEATKAATSALSLLAGLDHDVCVGLLRGTCASVIYRAAGFGAGDIRAVIKAQDNAAAWWTGQQVGWALSRHADDQFVRWSEDAATTFGRTSPIGDLEMIAWTRAFASDWQGWRSVSRQLAQAAIAAASDPKMFEGCLNLLVEVGAKKEVGLAARRTWRQGPVSALKASVDRRAARGWPLSVEGATMALLRHAGDLLDISAAEECIAKIDALIREGGPVRRHAGGTAFRWSEVSPAISRLLCAAGSPGHETVAHLLVDSIDAEQGTFDELLRVAAEIRWTAIPAELQKSLVDAATDRSDSLGTRLLAALAGIGADVMPEVRRRASAGDHYAERALVAEEATTARDWTAFGRRVAGIVRHELDTSRGDNGETRISVYSHPPLHDLTVASLQTRNLRHWKLVTDALKARVMSPNDVVRTIDVLGRRFADLPPSVAARVKALSATVDVVPNPMDPVSAFGPRLVLAVRTGAKSAGDVLADEPTLRTSDPVSYLRIVATMQDARNVALTAVELTSHDASARAHAAFFLVEAAAEGLAGADIGTIDRVLSKTLVAESGCEMARAAGSALSQHTAIDMPKTAAVLEQHPSAIIRSLSRVE